MSLDRLTWASGSCRGSTVDGLLAWTAADLNLTVRLPDLTWLEEISGSKLFGQRREQPACGGVLVRREHQA